jgi:hypothetical protein
MSIGMLAADWTDLVSAASDRAISVEARRSNRLMRAPANETPSVSVDEAYDSFRALFRASQEAAEPDWDGHGGRPVSAATVAQALAFLNVLPRSAPQPEFSAHPDGELAFEWSFGPRRILTISVNEFGRLSYAALIGHNRQHGTEFILDKLPSSITLVFQRLYSAK